MGDTWVVDITDFDYKNDEEHEMPARAKKMADYFGSIVLQTSDKNIGEEINTGIQCRRRPGRKLCEGKIRSVLQDSNRLSWWCPLCKDESVISNWRGTRWDSEMNFFSSSLNDIQLSDETVNEYEDIKGIIEWDDRSNGQFPKIKSGNKEYRWIDLGRELMSYEGFTIQIKITK